MKKTINRNYRIYIDKFGKKKKAYILKKKKKIYVNKKTYGTYKKKKVIKVANKGKIGKLNNVLDDFIKDSFNQERNVSNAVYN